MQEFKEALGGVRYQRLTKVGQISKLIDILKSNTKKRLIFHSLEFANATFCFLKFLML